MTAGDLTISLTEVTLSDEGFSGWVPSNMTASDTVLLVEAKLESEGPLTNLSDVQVWATDETGSRFDIGTSLSIADLNSVVWLYAVPKTSTSFLLWFPSGEIIDLSPLL